MASILNFINQASGWLNGLNSGCTFLLSCSGEIIKFPVTPGSYEITNSYNNSTVNINALGDINMIGRRGLTTIKFSSFFPAQRYNFSDNAINPQINITLLQRLEEKQQPCRLSISGTNINTAVTIDGIVWREQDGTSDVYFDISLREYRYILPTSEQLNDTTQLTSRVAETLTEKAVPYYPDMMDLMDLAANACQSFAIDAQDKKQAKVYKELAKTTVDASSEIKISPNHFKINNKVIKF